MAAVPPISQYFSTRAAPYHKTMSRLDSKSSLLNVSNTGGAQFQYTFGPIRESGTVLLAGMPASLDPTDLDFVIAEQGRAVATARVKSSRWILPSIDSAMYTMHGKPVRASVAQTMASERTYEGTLLVAAREDGEHLGLVLRDTKTGALQVLRGLERASLTALDKDAPLDSGALLSVDIAVQAPLRDAVLHVRGRESMLGYNVKHRVAVESFNAADARAVLYTTIGVSNPYAWPVVVGSLYVTETQQQQQQLQQRRPAPSFARAVMRDAPESEAAPAEATPSAFFIKQVNQGTVLAPSASTGSPMPPRALKNAKLYVLCDTALPGSRSVEWDARLCDIVLRYARADSEFELSGAAAIVLDMDGADGTDHEFPFTLAETAISAWDSDAEAYHRMPRTNAARVQMRAVDGSERRSVRDSTTAYSIEVRCFNALPYETRVRVRFTSLDGLITSVDTAADVALQRGYVPERAEDYVRPNYYTLDAVLPPSGARGAAEPSVKFVLDAVTQG